MTTELVQPPATDEEAALAEAAQRCIMAALDHSRAQKIALIGDGADRDSAPVLELPPQALRLFADILGLMAERRPITLVPYKLELTTQEAANFLQVSRPFLIKQIESGKLGCRKVGRHRRVDFEELVRFKAAMRQESAEALQELADLSQELGMGY